MSNKFLFLFFALLLSSCVAPSNRNYESTQEEAFQSERFVTFEVKYGYRLVYDRETGVEYFLAKAGNGGADYLTPILDRDGKPKIHDDIKL